MMTTQAKQIPNSGLRVGTLGVDDAGFRAAETGGRGSATPVAHLGSYHCASENLFQSRFLLGGVEYSREEIEAKVVKIIQEFMPRVVVNLETDLQEMDRLDRVDLETAVGEEFGMLGVNLVYEFTPAAVVEYLMRRGENQKKEGA